MVHWCRLIIRRDENFMNQLLKILAALALIMVIIAAAIFIVNQVNRPERHAQADRAPADGKPPRDAAVYPVGTNIAPDHSLQPAYKPINQPAYLQMLRQQGKTYRSTIAGRLSGKATRADWGMKGSVYFTYLYVLQTSGKILTNNGMTIVEERAFDRAQEKLLVSGYEIGFDLGERLGELLHFLYNVDKRGFTVKVSKGFVDLARQSGLFRDLPQIDPEKLAGELRWFSPKENERLLEGKVVRITFVDGQGITKIEPVKGALSQRERDLIVRANFVLDHYVMPDRRVAPGDTWEVDGSLLSGFLDPRLDGRAVGHLNIVRQPDFVAADGTVNRRLKLLEGEIEVMDVDRSQTINGSLTGLKGVLTMPETAGVVTVATVTGFASYERVSEHHLIFEARHAVKPKFEIRYECKVE